MRCSFLLASLLSAAVALPCSSLPGDRLCRADEPVEGPVRWNAAIAAFDAQDDDDPPELGGVVFVGSSSIRLWDLKASFPSLGAINRGFGGSHLADSVHFADRLVLRHRPRTVVLYAGDNDLWAGKSPARVHADFKAFVSKVRSGVPEARILYIAIKPSLARWKIADDVRTANRLIETECAGDERLVFVDIFTPMLGEDGMPRPELFVKDGLHLNEAGYRVWTETLSARLKDIAASR